MENTNANPLMHADEDDEAIAVIFTPDDRFPEGQFYSTVAELAEWPALSKEFELASQYLVYNKGAILIQSVPDLTMVLQGVIHGNAELTIFGKDTQEMEKGVQHVMLWFDACVQATVGRGETKEGDNDNG